MTFKSGLSSGRRRLGARFQGRWSRAVPADKRAGWASAIGVAVGADAGTMRSAGCDSADRSALDVDDSAHWRRNCSRSSSRSAAVRCRPTIASSRWTWAIRAARCASTAFRNSLRRKPPPTSISCAACTEADEAANIKNKVQRTGRMGSQKSYQKHSATVSHTVGSGKACVRKFCNLLSGKC